MKLAKAFQELVCAVEDDRHVESGLLRNHEHRTGLVYRTFDANLHEGVEQVIDGCFSAGKLVQ